MMGQNTAEAMHHAHPFLIGALLTTNWTFTKSFTGFIKLLFMCVSEDSNRLPSFSRKRN